MENAELIVGSHNDQSMSYSLTRKLVDLSAHFITIGCIQESPGFMTVHLAQEELGLTKKINIAGLGKVNYKKYGKDRLFTRRDIGGCSMGFHKFYNHYIQEMVLKQGYFGGTYSLSILAKDSYEIERKLIEKDKRFPLCDNPDCFFCRRTWLYNKRDWVSYYPRALVRKTFGKA